MTEIVLTDFQQDALNEVGHIGMGSATTALSQMVDKRVQLNLTNAQVLDAEAIIQNLPDSIIMTGVLLKMRGDFQGAILMLFEFKNAVVLSDMMLEGTEYEADAEMHESALEEVANILAGSYLYALSQFLNINAIQSVPYMITVTIAEILDMASVQMGRNIDKILNIETMFMVQSVGHSSGVNTLYGDMFVLLDDDSLQVMLDSINNLIS